MSGKLINVNVERFVAEPSLLGESPFWHPDEKVLYFVDIPAKQLKCYDPARAALQSWSFAQEVGCCAPARDGSLILALRDGFYRFDPRSGHSENLVRFGFDTTTARFNDGKCDPAGRFWAGTMYEPRDAKRGELYCMEARDGGPPLTRLMASNVVVANGLAFSPDGHTAYWSDTTHHVIRAYDYDLATGILTRPRVFHQFEPKRDGQFYGGRPDGASVDDAGNYWVAMYEGARVLKLSPAGKIVDEIGLPVRCPTMPVFGGDDLRTLFITTARHGRPAEELAAQPDAGCVLAMRVDTPGLPVNFYAG